MADGAAPDPERDAAEARPGSEASTGGELAIAIAQFAPGSDAAENLGEIERLARIAVARGARLVVLPEYSMFFTPELGQEMADAAEPLDGGFVRALGALAGDLGVHLVAGVLEAIPGDRARFSNTLVALDDDGRLVARYRKQHLYDAFGQRESERVVAGALDEPEIFTVDGVAVGMQTCYDLRFPEVTRVIVDAGADLVLVPAEWVRGPLKEHHWRTLALARAIENTVYLAAADQTPPVAVGRSLVVDPMGVEIAALGEQADVAVAWVSRERLAAVRRTNPALSLRRYGVVRR